MLRAMASGGDPESLSCPSCGAPITTVECERCLYCGTAISPQAKKAELVFVEADSAYWNTRRINRLGYLGTFLFVCISMYMVYPQFHEALERQRSVASAEKETPGRNNLHLGALLGSVPNDSGKRMLLFSAQIESERALCLLDPETAVTRWASTSWRGPLGKDQIAIWDDKILVVDQSRLVSLDARDGRMLWQASLTADFDPDRKRLMVSEGRVAVLTRDGTAQVFDVSSGRALWARRQNPPPREFIASGNLLIISGDNAINVIELEDGKIRQSLQARQSNLVSFQLDGEDLYVFNGLSSFVDRWSLKTGNRKWHTNSTGLGPDIFRRGWGLVLGGEHLLYSFDGAVYAIRKSDGTLERIAFDAEVKPTVLLAQGNLLVIATTPQWDSDDWAKSKNCSLWGFDIAKRVVLWRHNLPNGPQFVLAPIEYRVIGRLGPDGLTLAQAGVDELILDRIDPNTGSSSFHRQLKFSRPDFVFARPVYHGDLLWLTSSKGFHGIDVKTGSVVYHFE